MYYFITECKKLSTREVDGTRLEYVMLLNMSLSGFLFEIYSFITAKNILKNNITL
jgi:hypothetical protein